MRLFRLWRRRLHLVPAAAVAVNAKMASNKVTSSTIAPIWVSLRVERAGQGIVIASVNIVNNAKVVVEALVMMKEESMRVEGRSDRLAIVMVERERNR